jgi:CHASE3 domain sensor protein
MAVGLGFVLAAVVAIALLALRSEEADQRVSHTIDVQQAAENLLGLVRNAESGQRAYILTGRTEYLEPVEEAEAKLPGLLASIKALTVDNRVQQARVERLAPLLEDRMSFIRRTAGLAQRGDHDAAVELIASGEGRKLMERVVAEMSGFYETEINLLRARQETSRQLRLWLTTLIVLALLAAIVLAGVLAVATRQAVTGLLSRTRELEAESKLRHEAEETLRQAVQRRHRPRLQQSPDHHHR